VANNPSQYAPDFSRRYWLFHWVAILPVINGGRGGILDFKASFDTIELAKNWVSENCKDYKNEVNQWQQGHIFDIVEGDTPMILSDGVWWKSDE